MMMTIIMKMSVFACLCVRCVKRISRSWRSPFQPPEPPEKREMKIIPLLLAITDNDPRALLAQHSRLLRLGASVSAPPSTQKPQHPVRFGFSAAAAAAAARTASWITAVIAAWPGRCCVSASEVRPAAGFIQGDLRAATFAHETRAAFRRARCGFHVVGSWVRGGRRPLLLGRLACTMWHRGRRRVLVVSGRKVF